MIARLAAAALLLGLAVPAQAQRGVLRAFDAWFIACDNVHACKAYGFVSKDGGEDGALVLTRAAGGAAAPELGLILSEDQATELKKAGRLSVSADGAALGVLELGKGLENRLDDGAINPLRDAAVAGRILGSLRTAKSLALGLAGEAEPLLRISLAGASAALLFMDERQGRLGTTTALVRVGPKGAEAVPAARPLPAPPAAGPVAGKPVPKVPPAAVLARRKAEPKDTCNLEDDEIVKAGPEVAARLSATQVLWGLACWRGAYNTSSIFYIQTDGPAGGSVAPALTRPAFDWPGRDDDRQNHVLVNADFDEKTLLLSAFSKSRGLGDCGTVEHWRWDGRAFVPTYAAAMPFCNGLIMDAWPELHRTQERTR